MWRSATARIIFTTRILPPLRPNPNPNPLSFFSHTNPSSSSYGRDRTGVLVTSHLHSSATDPWSREAVVPPSAAAAAAAVTGSLGRKAGDLSDVLRHYGKCYWELSKAKLSMLVVATSGTGFVLGSGHVIDFAGLCCTCAGTMMVAASASTLNQPHN